MIDVFATEGTFSDKHGLARNLPAAVMRWEKVPELQLFRSNTAAFIHNLPVGAIANVDGDGDYVRVQILTPEGVLNREKQVGVVREVTDLMAQAAGNLDLARRTWVLITESPDGGWGIGGVANTGADIAKAAREELESDSGRVNDPDS
jgi:phenylpyruvate tautomerase PptA (4-oxalocrotonate tautomerase family)